MALANVSNQLLRSQGNDSTTVAANYPITGDGSTQLPLGLAEDYRGADGTSVTFEISAIPSGHRVTLSGAQGQESFDVMNGATGPSGAQGETGQQGPEGPQGPSGAQGPAGQDGVDGVSPIFRFSENETGVTVFVSGAQGEDSFRLYNGNSGHEYSAGPNIDITDFTISGKDWTTEIESAISSVSGDYYPMTSNPSGFLTAHQDISNLMPKSESANFYPMTGNPSGFLTAHQDLTNLPYVQNSALNYTPSTLVSGISGHELYAESANHAFTAETANYVEGGWEYDSENHISSYNGSAFVGQNQATYDVKASSNINVATAGNTFTVSGKDWTDTITAASAYAASQAQGKTYTGVAPIVVNNSEDKISANCIELSAGSGIDSNKLATGVIEVSGGLASGLTVCAYSAVTNDLDAFYYSVKDNPQDYVICMPYSSGKSAFAYFNKSDVSVYPHPQYPTMVTVYSDVLRYRCDDNIETTSLNVQHSYWDIGGTTSHDTVGGSVSTDTVGAGGAAISGVYNLNGDTITANCSALCMYEQANSPGSFQLMATANNASWYGYGYTMSNSETVLMNNVSSVAQNYATSAVSSHIVPIAYADITYSGIRDVIFNNGIVIPYDTTQGYGTFYNFVGSAVDDSTSSFIFRHIQTNGYCTTLTVSSYNYGATTGKVKNQTRIFVSPSEAECKVVVVATSGDIPASGETDGKLYVVTGSGT